MNPHANPDRRESVGDGFGLLGEADIRPELPFESVWVPGVRQQLLGFPDVKGVERGGPGELEVAWDDAARHPREPERQRLVDGLAVDRVVDGQTYTPVAPERFRIPLLGEQHPLLAVEADRFQREPRCALDFLGDWTPHDVRDVDFPPLEHRQARGLVRHGFEYQTFDAGTLSPVLLVGLQDQFHSRSE